MTTEEFAELVVATLDQQEYFKRGQKSHPEDIAVAFTAAAETIGSTMSWAISKDHTNKKNAILTPSDLKKLDEVIDNDLKYFD